MNKYLLGIVILAVIVTALATTGFVYAQAPLPQDPTQTPVDGTGFGYGRMGDRGYRGGMRSANAAGYQDGFLHDEMIAAFAQGLGMPVEDLNARLAGGETMAQIAYSKGLTAEQFTALMANARSQAIDQAVQNGTLTQEQADWMKQRGAGGLMSGRGQGNRGSAQGPYGPYANPDCPYVPQTQP